MNILTANDKVGIAHYQFNDPAILQSANHYKLKIINRDHSISYSQTIVIKDNENTGKDGLLLLQNPVQCYLEFIYTASINSTATLTIYNLSGARIYSKPMQIIKASDLVRLPLESKMIPGLYILEVSSAGYKTTSKFIKQ